MIRVPKDKAVEVMSKYKMFNEKGMLVYEGEVWLRVVEEQFNRMKSSYDSGKFMGMFEDESLQDLHELFVAKARKAKWQRILVDYPTDIIRGFTFEAEAKDQWDAEAFEEFSEKFLNEFFSREEQKKEMKRVAKETCDAALRELKIDDDICDLIDWMRSKGFDAGERCQALKDDNGRCVGEVDIAWPFGVYGLQGGFNKPVALRIGADTKLIEAAREVGFTCFASIKEFKAFVEKNYWRK